MSKTKRPEMTDAETRALSLVIAGKADKVSAEMIARLSILGHVTVRTVSRAANGRLLDRSKWTQIVKVA